jgi:hypothetical protein
MSAAALVPLHRHMLTTASQIAQVFVVSCPGYDERAIDRSLLRSLCHVWASRYRSVASGVHEAVFSVAAAMAPMEPAA